MNPGNWNILFHWRIIVTQFCVFACYSRLQNIQQNIEGTTIHSQLPTKKTPRELFCHCSTSAKYGWCRRAQRFRLLRCSTIKRVAWCLRNWCLNTKLIICIISSAIWAKFKSKKHATSWNIWTCSIVPPKRLMVWRAQLTEIWYRRYFKLLTEFDGFLTASTFLVRMQQWRQKFVLWFCRDNSSFVC